MIGKLNHVAIAVRDICNHQIILMNGLPFQDSQETSLPFQMRSPEH